MFFRTIGDFRSYDPRTTTRTRIGRLVILSLVYPLNAILHQIVTPVLFLR